MIFAASSSLPTELFSKSYGIELLWVPTGRNSPVNGFIIT